MNGSNNLDLINYDFILISFIKSCRFVSTHHSLNDTIELLKEKKFDLHSHIEALSDVSLSGVDYSTPCHSEK